MKLRVVVLLSILTTFSMVACGQSEPTETTRSLTDAETTRLAQTRNRNYLSGGAKFEATSAFLGIADPETITLTGVIDWVKHAGRATVNSSLGTDVVEVYWEETFLLERRLGFDTISPALGGPSEPWFVRLPEPSTRQLDRLLGIIMSLASEQPENALLIQQEPGTSFLRSDLIRGNSADVLRFGERNTYWLRTATDEMLRFESNAEAGLAPVLVDILESGPFTAEAPKESDVLSPQEFPEIYAQIQGWPCGTKNSLAVDYFWQHCVLLWSLLVAVNQNPIPPTRLLSHRWCLTISSESK